MPGLPVFLLLSAFAVLMSGCTAVIKPDKALSELTDQVEKGDELIEDFESADIGFNFLLDKTSDKTLTPYPEIREKLENQRPKYSLIKEKIKSVRAAIMSLRAKPDETTASTTMVRIRPDLEVIKKAKNEYTGECKRADDLEDKYRVVYLKTSTLVPKIEKIIAIHKRNTAKFDEALMQFDRGSSSGHSQLILFRKKEELKEMRKYLDSMDVLFLKYLGLGKKLCAEFKGSEYIIHGPGLPENKDIGNFLSVDNEILKELRKYNEAIKDYNE